MLDSGRLKGAVAAGATLAVIDGLLVGVAGVPYMFMLGVIAAVIVMVKMGY